jgi:hypothetical protein
MQWFEERGFELSNPLALPKYRECDKVRESKVYIKKLELTRDIDAEELMRNIT